MNLIFKILIFTFLVFLKPFDVEGGKVKVMDKKLHFLLQKKISKVQIQIFNPFKSYNYNCLIYGSDLVLFNKNENKEICRLKGDKINCLLDKIEKIDFLKEPVIEEKYNYSENIIMRISINYEDGEVLKKKFYFNNLECYSDSFKVFFQTIENIIIENNPLLPHEKP